MPTGDARATICARVITLRLDAYFAAGKPPLSVSRHWLPQLQRTVLLHLRTGCTWALASRHKHGFASSNACPTAARRHSIISFLGSHTHRGAAHRGPLHFEHSGDRSGHSDCASIPRGRSIHRRRWDLSAPHILRCTTPCGVCQYIKRCPQSSETYMTLIATPFSLLLPSCFFLLFDGGINMQSSCVHTQ